MLVTSQRVYSVRRLILFVDLIHDTALHSSLSTQILGALLSDTESDTHL
jgi:hypothetical protein